MTRQEIVMVFSEAGEPVGIARKNGTTTFYKLRKMTFDEIFDLLHANDEPDETGDRKVPRQQK
jgi:hypothetical protein